jgi:protein-disulfide isomerase
MQNIYGRKIYYVFRHFPLVEIHELSEYCAQAAEAANAQGEFWRMHDALFEHQDRLSKETIFQIARKIRLDLNRFSNDLECQRFQNRVQQDIQLGNNDHVNQTPTFFINGDLYRGESDPKSLAQAIGDQLAQLKDKAA